jgi:hypothetical protein
MARNRYHDIGGLPAARFVPTDEPWLFWEKQAEAIRNLLGESARRLASLDEIRHSFETMGKDLYGRLSFYERRLEALVRILERKGILTRAELERKISEKKFSAA